MIRVHINKRSGKFITTLELPDDATTEDLKNLYNLKYHYYPERQWFNIGSAKGAILKEGSLASNGVTDNTNLFFKDLGVQISWRLVFVLEYLGPILVMLFLWMAPGLVYGLDNVEGLQRCFTQKVAVALFLLHFIKREAETLFVHRFSNATMPLHRLALNCAHYWVICALSIGYFLCHPKYKAPFAGSHIAVYLLSLAFLVFEGLNFATHLILRGLRSRGTKERGIPRGAGFEWVSCANYFWESSAWVVFSIMTMCLTSYLFTAVAFGQMAIWALKKHKSYRANFPDYPKSRKAIIPFLL